MALALLGPGRQCCRHRRMNSAPAPAAAPPERPRPPAVASASASVTTGQARLWACHANPRCASWPRELGVPLHGKSTAQAPRAASRKIECTALHPAGDERCHADPSPGGGGRPRPQPVAVRAWIVLPGLAPKVDFAKFGPVERKDLSRIKDDGANLHRNWCGHPVSPTTMTRTSTSGPSVCSSTRRNEGWRQGRCSPS